MPVLDDYLSIVEAAQILGVHPGTMKRLCRNGKFEAKKVHNTWLIRSGTLHLFAEGYKGRRGRPPTKKT